MKVIIICSTYWNGRKRNPGDELTVDTVTAERWITKGIAQVADDTSDDDLPMLTTEEGLDSPALLAKEDLEKLSLEGLREYAVIRGVDIGKATTDKGILEKIIEAGKVLTNPEA